VGQKFEFLVYFRFETVTAMMSTLPQNIIIHVDYSLQSENVVKCKQCECLVLDDILFSWNARTYTFRDRSDRYQPLKCAL